VSGERPERRLFFALWPSPGIRAGIVERRTRIEGLSRRRVPDHNLHLTLLFLGDQPADRLDEIVAAAESLKTSGFRLLLDRFGWFARARVAWLGGCAPCAGQTLVAQLAASMSGLGLQFDARPWAPHVTLFRQVRSSPTLPQVEPLAWSADRFELVESLPGQPYVPLASFKLG
jgi:2'-5' RNA ligase